MDLTRVRPKDMPEVRDRLFKDTDEQTAPMKYWLRRVGRGEFADRLEGGEPRDEADRRPQDFALWHVSEEMARVAASAAPGVDLTEAALHCPDRGGVMHIPRGLFLPPRGFGGAWGIREVFVDAVVWRRRADGTIGLSLYDLRPTAFGTWSELSWGADFVYSGDLEPLIGPSRLNLSSEAEEMLDGVRRFVAATWLLAQEPTVATVTPKVVPGAKIKGQRRRQAPSEVKVVELRTMKHQTVTHSSSGRQYTHRWIVRGHWRDQPCGPGLKQRRRTWVPAYTKGPDDAPLLEKETVFAWRR